MDGKPAVHNMKPIDPVRISVGNAAPDPSHESDADSVRQLVRSDYAPVAQASDAGNCCGETSGCCGVSEYAQINSLISVRLGYSQADLDAIPEGADMGLGCGNPRAIASLRSACVAGASLIDDLRDMIRAAGFTDIRIGPKDESREFIRDWAPGRSVYEYVISATIEAVKS
jgi:hypothetical protein